MECFVCMLVFGGTELMMPDGRQITYLVMSFEYDVRKSLIEFVCSSSLVGILAGVLPLTYDARYVTKQP